MGLGEDFDERYMRMAAKDSHKTNDDYTIDDMFVDRAARTGRKGQKESRDRDRAINREWSARCGVICLVGVYYCMWGGVMSCCVMW